MKQRFDIATTPGYVEKRTVKSVPNKDASDVVRWVLSPAAMAAPLGFSMFFGLALAGTSASTAGFVLGAGMFGAGLTGVLMMFARILTYDKNPQTEEAVERRATEQPSVKRETSTISGNAAVFVPTREPHIVEWNGEKYDFDDRQIRLMYDRIEANNLNVSRDEWKIETSEFPTVGKIMTKLDYWKPKGRSYVWTPDGVTWLESQMRRVAT